MKKPVLVIMAAGMGSRYGGLKQIDPVDPEGHIIMDFSLYDAKKAGFEEVIFIIKKENEKVTVKILEQTVFILLKFFPACNLAYSGISNPLKELTKKLANIKTGITIPFIRPYFEIAKE